MSKSKCQMKDKIDLKWIGCHHLAFLIGCLTFDSGKKDRPESLNAIAQPDTPMHPMPSSHPLSDIFACVRKDMADRSGESIT